jgi:hypothetical protein
VADLGKDVAVEAEVRVVLRQVGAELRKEDLVALDEALVVVRLPRDAVVGQMAEGVPEVICVRMRRHAKHTLPPEQHTELNVHDLPRPPMPLNTRIKRQGGFGRGGQCTTHTRTSNLKPHTRNGSCRARRSEG